MFHKITLRYGCQRTHTQQRDVSKRSPDSRANSTSCLEKLSLSPRNSAQIDRKKLLNLHRDVWSIARSRGSSTKLGRTLLIVPDPRRLSLSLSLSRTRVHTHTHTFAFSARELSARGHLSKSRPTRVSLASSRIQRDNEASTQWDETLSCCKLLIMHSWISLL